MPEKWPLLTRKYGRLHSESFPTKPVTINIETLTVKEVKRLKSELEARKKRTEIDQVMQFVHDIQYEFYPTGFIRFPIPSLFEHERDAKVMVAYRLRGKIEEVQSKVDKIRETIKILTDAVFSDEVKRKVKDYVCDIRIRYELGGIRGASSRIHWSKYQALADLTTEKIECLKEAIQFHNKVITVYKKELKQRNARKTEIPMIIETAKQLCKTAEKCRKLIVKVNEKVFKADRMPSFAESKIFMENRKKFEQCSREYYALKDKLRFITDEQIPFPQFPMDLTIDITSRKRQFERAYKQGKRR